LSLIKFAGLGAGVRVPAGAWNFSLHHRVQTDSGKQQQQVCRPSKSGGL